jgi:inosine-uridine nucleoside N-ribohydrolase
MPKKLILDVDTGTDDAVAIMLAALHPDLDLLGVTTVAGNVEVAHCTDNSLRTLDWIGRPDIPVHEGLHRPIVRRDFPVPRKSRKPSGVHFVELPIPPPRSEKQKRGAVEFLIETFRAATDEIVLVPTGPLSNIAAAIAIDPGFVDRVPELVIMGGGHHTGNVTPAAEFNIWADPEAAASVFSAGFRRIVLAPLDATHQALVSAADCARLAALGKRIAGYDANQPMAERGAAPVHDALCVAYLVDPDIITTRHLHVDVETVGTLTVGRTVIDTNFRGGGTPNCHVAFGANRRAFVDLLLSIFAGGPAAPA